MGKMMINIGFGVISLFLGKPHWQPQCPVTWVLPWTPQFCGGLTSAPRTVNEFWPLSPSFAPFSGPNQSELRAACRAPACGGLQGGGQSHQNSLAAQTETYGCSSKIYPKYIKIWYFNDSQCIEYI